MPKIEHAALCLAALALAGPAPAQTATMPSTMPATTAATMPAVKLEPLAPLAAGPIDADRIRTLRDRIKPSLVAVEYTYAGEGGRQVLVGEGFVVSDDGVVAISGVLTPEQLPDAQLTDFKIIIPGEEETRLDATFQGRDPRTELAFVKVADADRGKYGWRAVELSGDEPSVGDEVLSAGLLPESAGYQTYVTAPMVSATLRGPIPQVLVTPQGLAGVGSLVLNSAGQVEGMVQFQPQFQRGALPFLNSNGPGGGNIGMLATPARTFVPSSFMRMGIDAPPTPEKPVKVADIGIRQSSGLSKDLAEFYDLKGKPAIEVGEVLPDMPAAKAGLKSGDVIVTLNGKPLERGDEPDELPQIFGRTLMRLPVGSDVKLGVMRDKDQPLKEIAVNLKERPKPANLAERFFAEDLGFSVRELVFNDRYEMKLEPKTTGVVVAFIKQGSSAQSAGLKGGDVITRLNQTAVQGVDQFKQQFEAFRKAKPTEAAVMEVIRGANTQIVRVEPPQK